MSPESVKALLKTEDLEEIQYNTIMLQKVELFQKHVVNHSDNPLLIFLVSHCEAQMYK